MTPNSHRTGRSARTTTTATSGPATITLAPTAAATTRPGATGHPTAED